MPEYPDLPNYIGYMVVLDPRTGAPLSGYGRDFGGPVNVWSAADLNGDGQKELLVAQLNATTGHWYLHEVAPTAGLPDLNVIDLGVPRTALPEPVVTVCDVTGSGSPEVIVGFDNTVHVLDSHLHELWNWSAPGGKVLLDTIVSDLGDDGRIEIIATSYDPNSVTQGSFPMTVNVLASPQNGTPKAIPPDRFEFPIPNNTPATATDLGSVQGVKQLSGLTIYQPTDVDWFKFQTTALGSNDNSVAIDFNHTAGMLDLGLFDSSGRLVGTFTYTTDHKEVSLAGLPAGEYYVGIAGHNGATSPGYTLTVNAPAGTAIPKDQFEPNDTLATATDLNPPDTAHSGQDAPLTGTKTLSHLSIYSSTDLDYLKFTTAAAGIDGDFVQINFDVTQGNLDLQLLDAFGNVLSSFPNTQVGQKLISLSGLPAKTYYVEVSGDNGATNPDYSLTVAAPSATGPLPPDWTGGTHTSLNTALDLGAISGQHAPYTNLSINASNKDEWFKFQTVASGTDANFVRIDFASAQGNLGLEVDDASGTTLYSSTSVTDFQQISLGGLAAGTYYVRVFGVNGTTNPSYSLTVDAPDTPGSSIPPDWAEPNNTQATAYDLGTVQNQQSWDNLSIYQPGKDEWFKFQMAGAGSLTVQIDFSNGQGDLDLQVIDPNNNTIVSDTTNDYEQVSLASTPAGTYYVHVLGYNGATNPHYSLTINAPASTIPPDWAEPNDTLATAHDLGTVQNQQSWDNLSIDQPGNDDWFKFTTAAAGAQGNQIRIDFDASQGALDVALTDGSGNVLAQSSNSGTGKAISLSGAPAGTYYIHVFGVNGATNPNYTLTINAPAAAASTAQWDVLLYGDGDQQGGQNRDYDVAHDVQTLEQVKLPSQVNVGVLWGRSTESSWGTNTVEGWLTYDRNSQYGYPSSQLTPVTDSSGNDPDMADPNTLSNFIIKMVNDRPAAHYAVVIKDHGGAWTGAEEDDATGHLMPPHDIEKALATAEAQTGKQIDLLAFDTCLNGTAETLYDFRNTTSVIVASEAETSSSRQNPDGTWNASTWNLATMVKDLAANPSMSPEKFAATMVADMTPGQLTTGMGATRTSAYADLAASMNAFAQAVASSTDPAGDWSAIVQARSQTVWFADEVSSNDQNDRDLGTFMSLVAQGAATSAVRNAAQDVSAKLAAAVIALNPNDGSIFGMGTFLPQPGSLSPFDGTSSWGSFISPQQFDLFQGQSGATPWFGFLQSLSQRTASNPTNAITLGPSFSARAKADPLHALAGSWTVGTFAQAPGSQGDWFQFQTLAPGGSADNVTITFPNAQGNLTLELDDANGNLVQTSTTTSGTEQVSLSGRPAGIYYIHISGPQGNPGYTLTINAPTVSQPQQDWTGANNSLAKAYDLGAIDPAGSRFIGLTMDAGPTNAGRQKWFAVEFPIALKPAPEEIDLQYAPGSPHNLHLALYDATGKLLIQAGTTTANGEAVTQNGLTGRYYVLVSGNDTSTTNPGFALAFSASAVQSAGQIQFSAPTYSVNETGGSVTITATRTGGSAGAVSVQYATSDGTGKAGTDYTAVANTLSWAAGDTASKTFTILILDDNATGESNETVNLALSSPTGGATLGTQGTAVLTITEDNDTLPAGTLQFTASTYSVSETGGSVTVQVTRTGGSSGPLSATFSTSNGTAIAGTDYTATTQTLNWADGDTASKTVTIPILDDNATGENNETVNLALTGTALGSPSTAVLTITEDNDTLPAGQIQFSAPTYSVKEDGGSISVTVTRTGGSVGAVSVPYATSDGTAKAGIDYTAVSNTLSWAAGDTTPKSFSISILDDPQADGDETVNLSLGTPSGGASLGTPNSATLTIHDAPAVLQFAGGLIAANVSNGSAQIVLTRAGNLPATVTVVVSSHGGPEVAAFQRTVTFGPNTPSAAVTVPIQNDGHPGERDVLIPLSLSSPGPGAILGATTTATLVVHDNNPFPPLVTVASLQPTTVRITTGTGKRKKTKTETGLLLKFSGNLAGTGNSAAYRLLTGKTKKGVTTYNKFIPLTVFNATPTSVTLLPSGNLNLSQPMELRVTAAFLTDAFGRQLNGGQGFVATFGKRVVTSAQVQSQSRTGTLSASAVDAVFAEGLIPAFRRTKFIDRRSSAGRSSPTRAH